MKNQIWIVVVSLLVICVCVGIIANWSIEHFSKESTTTATTTTTTMTTTKATTTNKGSTTSTTPKQPDIEPPEDVHEHSYTVIVTSPTCTEKGYSTYVCECGDGYVGDYIDAIPHRYTAVVTNSTCTAQGYTTYYCACGDRYIDNYTDANGHSWGSWKTAVEPEVGKAGSEKRTCYVCKESETREIAALQEDLTQKWFINQYNIAKQQYINGLNSEIAEKENTIDDLREEASDLYVNYMKEVQSINERFASLGMTSSGTHQAALQNAQQNYSNSAKVYTNQITALENEITAIEAELANPNVDNILAIVTKNCNITSRETYEYYYKYSDSVS